MTNALTVTPASTLSERHELFVTRLMAGDSIAEAYQAVYPGVGSRAAARNHGSRLAARADVRQRIADLQAVAASSVVLSAEVMMRRLFEVGYEADPSAISRVVATPCPKCLKLFDADLVAGRELPDPAEPIPVHPRCVAPASEHQTVVVTPTDELNAVDRALFVSARQGRYGVEVELEDRHAARVELHKLLGLIVNRSESKNLNVDASITAADIEPANLLAMYNKTRQLTNGGR